MIFECAICGKDYDSIEERNKCEAACLAKQRKEMEEAKAKEKKLTQEADKKRIQDAFDKLSDDISAYIKKYDQYPPLNKDDEPNVHKLDFPWWFL